MSHRLLRAFSTLSEGNLIGRVYMKTFKYQQGKIASSVITGIGVGIAIGVALAVALENNLLGIGIGIAIGAGIVTTQSKHKGNSNTDK